MARFSRILSGFNSSPAAAAPPESSLILLSSSPRFDLHCWPHYCCSLCLAPPHRSSCLRSDFTSSAANKGFKKKILHSLPKFSYGSPAAVDGGPCKFEWTECAIFFGVFCDGEVVRVLLQCGHGFHIRCIDTWLGSHCVILEVTMYPLYDPSSSSLCSIS